MASEYIFSTVKTRTGKFSHSVLDMQPTTLCGTYLKFRASQMLVSGPVTCEKCKASQSQMEEDN